MEDTVNVRVPRALWESVRTTALHERRSASAQLAITIERGLGVPEDTPPPPAPLSSSSDFDRHAFGDAFERLGHGGNPFADPEPIEELTPEEAGEEAADRIIQEIADARTKSKHELAPFQGRPMVETNITVDEDELARMARPTDFPARPMGLKTAKPKGRK